MLDLIRVDVYGQKMPINQLATISVPESRLITVQVWDSNNVNLVDSAIRKSNLGINPQIDGQMLRLPIPSLTEERREELKKTMKEISEKSKISIRNIRREGKDELKKLLEKKSISEDENKKFEKEIQTITDSSIAEIEKVLEKKEKEIMSV
jgi:ribosome recycling factor